MKLFLGILVLAVLTGCGRADPPPAATNIDLSGVGGASGWPGKDCLPDDFAY